MVETLLGGEEVDPDKPDSTAEYPSRILLKMDMRKWRKYYSDGKGSSLTSQISTAEHPSRMLLKMDKMEWRKYYSSGVRSILTSRMVTEKHRSERGIEEVIKILLGREAVKPGKPDNDGQTPLTQQGMAIGA